MSQLNPGGRRNADGVARVFTYEGIRRLLQQRGRSYSSKGSIALCNRNVRNKWGQPVGAPHEHQREITRRARQNAARKSPT